MSIKERARAMRREGMAFAVIARNLNRSYQWIYKIAGDVSPVPQDGKETVVRMVPFNGGCSTLSGLMPIRMPRITALSEAV